MRIESGGEGEERKEDGMVGCEYQQTSRRQEPEWFRTSRSFLGQTSSFVKLLPPSIFYLHQASSSSSIKPIILHLSLTFSSYIP
jgi:hypothetical protein